MAKKNAKPAKTAPKKSAAKPASKKAPAPKKKTTAAATKPLAKKSAAKKPAAKRASPASKSAARKASPVKTKSASAKRPAAVAKKAPAARKPPVKLAAPQKKPAAKPAPAMKVSPPAAAKKAPPARAEAPRIPQPPMEQPQIIDIASTVPGAADIDMSIFAPPKPLEVASGEAVSDDDLATLREMEATQEAVDRVRKNAKLKPPPPEFDGKHCVTCEEEEIEPGRLQLGYFTCIHCESEKERMAKLFAR